jgi:hypothetical protein
VSAQPDPFLELARRAEAQGKRTDELLAELLALDEPPLGEHVWPIVEESIKQFDEGEGQSAQEVLDRLQQKFGA